MNTKSCGALYTATARNEDNPPLLSFINKCTGFFYVHVITRRHFQFNSNSLHGLSLSTGSIKTATKIMFTHFQLILRFGLFPWSHCVDWIGCVRWSMGVVSRFTIYLLSHFFEKWTLWNTPKGMCVLKRPS